MYNLDSFTSFSLGAMIQQCKSIVIHNNCYFFDMLFCVKLKGNSI